MRGFVLALIVLYVLLSFIGCLDRNNAVQNSRNGGEEKSDEIILGHQRSVRRGLPGRLGRNLAAGGSLATAGGNDH